MQISDILSIISLVIALAALPLSYYISIRQVKLGLKEQKKYMRLETLDSLITNSEEFLKIFYAVAREIGDLDSETLTNKPKLVDPHLKKIDNIVFKTGIYERLALSIDNVSNAGYKGIGIDDSTIDRLQSIRNLIALGKGKKRFVCLSIISHFEGNLLLSKLKKLRTALEKIT